MFETAYHQVQYHPDMQRVLQAASLATFAEVQAACNESLTPFPDGSKIERGADEYSHRTYVVQNDDRFITVERGDYPSFGCYYEPGSTRDDRWWDVDSFVSYAGRTIEDFPALEPLFGLTVNEKRLVTEVTMPTLPLMNLAQQELFDGLPVADITLAQTNIFGNTDALPFVTNLDDFIFTVSANIEDYRHDVDAHWLGTASLHAVDFGVWRQLFEHRDYIVDESFGFDRCRQFVIGDNAGISLNQKFIESLASGFDISTGRVLDMGWGRSLKYLSQDFLLAATLRQIKIRCNDNVLRRSVEVIRSLGMGAPQINERDGSMWICVPWGVENLPSHYDAVYQRLGIMR